MSKNVILFTIAGTLCLVSGAALAQANNSSRAPTGTGGLSAANGPFIAIPMVSALSLPATVDVARTPVNLSMPQNLAVAASNFSVASLTHDSKSTHRVDAAPDLPNAVPGSEKSSKGPGSLRKTKDDTGVLERHAKRPHQIPVCE
jgi:hypothetical protein